MCNCASTAEANSLPLLPLPTTLLHLNINCQPTCFLCYLLVKFVFYVDHETYSISRLNPPAFMISKAKALTRVTKCRFLMLRYSIVVGIDMSLGT